MSVFDKEKARLSFDRAAHQYDQSAKLQQDVARYLINLVVNRKTSAGSVLDIGCGTGQVTRAMCQQYPQAQVVGLDFAPRMLEQTRQSLQREGLEAELVCADAEQIPFGANRFDLIVSSLMLQWSNDLENTLRSYQQTLRSDGQLFFSTFSQGTLKEVTQSWQHVDQAPHTSQFMTVDDLQLTAERAGFSTVSIISDSMVMTYSSVREMIMEIKQIGASNAHKGRDKGLTGKQRFQAFEAAFEAFRLSNGEFPCTWELAYVVCER